MKARLKGAETGHRLLKKKADAMQLRFRSILKKIIEVKWFREIFAIDKTQYTFGRE
jgi:vacuolar-type H+-ATPase subunit D/Vma8